MYDLLAKIVDHFAPTGVNIVNMHFRLYSGLSMALCVLGSALALATQYFGEPIVCSFSDEVAKELATSHCWIHGSTHVSQEYQEDFDCISSQEGLESDAPTIAYCQWVPFLLLLQAALFALPHRIWVGLEGGLLESMIGQEERSALILSDSAVMEKSISQLIRRFQSLMHHSRLYFTAFVGCEILNIVVAIVNFCLTNSLLNHKFSSYGFDVLAYYETPVALRAINPMCDVFPTKASCNLKYVGKSGGMSSANGFCILAQNIVNEKFFLIMYFWYIALFTVAACYTVFRITTLTVNALRERLLRLRLRGRHRHVPVRNILINCYISDWFLLTRIADNTNVFFFKAFLAELIREENSKVVKGTKLESYELRPNSATSSPDSSRKNEKRPILETP